MTPTVIALGYAEALTLLFGLAVVHKASIIARGSAQDESLLMLTERRRRKAPLLMGLAAAAEVAVVAALVRSPVAGLLGATALLAFYWRELRRLEDTDSCACLGSFAETPARVAAMRNVVLAAGALISVAVLALGSGAGDPSERSLAVAAVVSAAVAAPVVLTTFLSRITNRLEESVR